MKSLNYAKVRKIRCLFIIENNNYSVYTPIKPRQSIIQIDPPQQKHLFLTRGSGGKHVSLPPFLRGNTMTSSSSSSIPVQ